MTDAYNDIRAAIESRVAAEMAKSPSYPISYENVAFTPPNNSPWLQLFVRFGDNRYATLMAPENGFNSQNGVVSINVFTPVGTGAAANYTIAKRVKALFDRKSFDNINFDSATGPASAAVNVLQSGVDAGSSLAAAYFQTQLTITFEGFVQ
jgi:hypothetical protein